VAEKRTLLVRGWGGGVKKPPACGLLFKLALGRHVRQKKKSLTAGKGAKLAKLWAWRCIRCARLTKVLAKGFDFKARGWSGGQAFGGKKMNCAVLA